MNEGMCRLCGCHGKLIDAHIIPRSFHGINKESKLPAQLLTSVEGRYAQKIRKGVYDGSILCEGCERRFSRCDDYADELFLKSWDKFELVKRDGEEVAYLLRNYDYSVLKLFFLSVLWRAAASGHPMFEKVDLGPREAALRNTILSSDPGDADHFGVVLQAFDDTKVGILDPHMERFDGIRFCRVYLAHVIAYIKVDSRRFQGAFTSCALSPDRPLLLLHKSFLRSEERRVMVNMVRADKRRRSRD